MNSVITENTWLQQSGRFICLRNANTRQLTCVHDFDETHYAWQSSTVNSMSTGFSSRCQWIYIVFIYIYHYERAVIMKLVNTENRNKKWNIEKKTSIIDISIHSLNTLLIVLILHPNILSHISSLQEHFSRHCLPKNPVGQLWLQLVPNPPTHSDQNKINKINSAVFCRCFWISFIDLFSFTNYIN